MTPFIYRVLGLSVLVGMFFLKGGAAFDALIDSWWPVFVGVALVQHGMPRRRPEDKETKPKEPAKDVAV